MNTFANSYAVSYKPHNHMLISCIIIIIITAVFIRTKEDESFQF